MKFMIFFNKSEQLNQTISAISQQDEQLKQIELRLKEQNLLYLNNQEQFYNHINNLRQQDEQMNKKIDQLEKSFSSSIKNSPLLDVPQSKRQFQRQHTTGMKMNEDKSHSDPLIDFNSSVNPHENGSQMSFGPSLMINGIQHRPSIKINEDSLNFEDLKYKTSETIGSKGQVYEQNHRHSVVEKHNLSMISREANLINKTIDPAQQIDLVFLYSDPIVSKSGSGPLQPVQQPLDLDEEYKNLVKSLKNTGKQFTIMREAINCYSLSQVIQKMPEIIHISSHGAFDKFKKEFYLAIENKDEVGQEDRIPQSRLTTLLRPPNDQYASMTNVKMAFVSACQSEEIGEIFLKSGVPVVIAVNSDQEIMDEVCKIFAANFYESLLQGSGIEEAFHRAKNLVDAVPQDYDICCCAHKHKDDCEWYKFYKVDSKAAHALHTKNNCACKYTEKRKHNPYCKDYQAFKEKLDSLRKQNQDKSTMAITGQIDQADTKANKFKNMLKNMIPEDSDGLMLSDYESDGVEAMQDDCIMCCCCKDTPHNESMKFQIKIAKEYDNENGRQTLLNSPIFMKHVGKLIDLDEKMQNLIKMPTFIDKQMIYGRQNDIFKCVTFLTDTKNPYRILVVTGIQGSGCNYITRSAIKYVINRNFFRHGILQIDATNSYSIETFYQKIKRRMGSIVQDPQELFEQLQNLELILLIDICHEQSELSEKDTSQLQNTINELTRHTDLLKIILVVEQDSPLNFKKHHLKKYIQQLRIEALDSTVAAEMMFKLNQDNHQFKKEYPTVSVLHKHQLFKFDLMPEKISEISILIQQGQQSLDEAYNQQIQISSQEQTQEVKTRTFEFNKNKINKFFYQKIINVYNFEFNILYVLCYAQSGLTEYDLMRITLLCGQYKEKKFSELCYQYGNWFKFLQQFIVDGNSSDQSATLSAFDDPDSKNHKSSATNQQLFMQKLSSVQLKKIADAKMPQQTLSNIQNKSLTEPPTNADDASPQHLPQADSVQTALETEIQMIQRKTNYYLISKVQKESQNNIQYVLQSSFKKYILEQPEMNFEKKRHFQIEYIKYMSILSRQLMRSIKQQKIFDFDPYIVSSSIDDGIWGEPQFLNLEMIFQTEEHEQYSKTYPIENASNFFWMHEGNFSKFFDIKEMMKTLEFIQNAEKFLSNSKVFAHLDEILINIPSIFVMLNRFTEAEELIVNIDKILNIQELQLTKAKILLIQASIHLSYKLDDKVDQNLKQAKKIFTQLNNNLGLSEIKYLEAVNEINKLQLSGKQSISPTCRNQRLSRFKNVKSNSMDQFDQFILNDNSSQQDRNSILQVIDEAQESPNPRYPNKTYKISLETKLVDLNNIKNMKERNFAESIQFILKKLKECRKILQTENAKICVAKSWILQADLVIEKLQNHESLQQKIFQENSGNSLSTLYRHLEDASCLSTTDNCEIIGTRCLLYLAKIKNLQQEYVFSKKLIEMCMRDSKQYGFTQILKEAKKLADEISNQLQKDSLNVYLFAKSCPISLNSNIKNHYNQVIHSCIQDNSQALIDIFEMSNKAQQKQLNLKFDILNQEFLEQVARNGSRLLHLTPYLKSVDSHQQNEMIIEGDQFQQQNLTPSQLRSILQPQKGMKLNVHFVLLEMPNCKNFADVFEDLGVPHVIYFSIMPKCSKGILSTEDRKQVEQHKLNLIIIFMRQFSKELYRLLSENKPILESIKLAKNEVSKQVDEFSDLNIRVKYNGTQKNDKLHEQEFSGTQNIENREVCDISKTRGQFEYQFNSQPFIVNEMQNFRNLANFVQFKQIDDVKQNNLSLPAQGNNDGAPNKTQKVNVFGSKGVGKTRLVIQVAEYLRYRYMFRAGVHYFDLQKTKNIDSLAQTFMQKRSKTLKQKRQNFKRSLSSAADNKNNRQSEDDKQEEAVLMIFDNCEEYIDQNRVPFEANLKYIEKQFSQMSIILISEKKLYGKDKEIKTIYLQPFEPLVSKVFFQTAFLSLGKKYENESTWMQAIQQIEKQLHISNGNSQILSILSLIYSYGGLKLLKKVKIQSFEKIYSPLQVISRDHYSNSNTNEKIDADALEMVKTFQNSIKFDKTESRRVSLSKTLNYNSIVNQQVNLFSKRFSGSQKSLVNQLNGTHVNKFVKTFTNMPNQQVRMRTKEENERRDRILPVTLIEQIDEREGSISDGDSINSSREDQSKESGSQSDQQLQSSDRLSVNNIKMEMMGTIQKGKGFQGLETFKQNSTPRVEFTKLSSSKDFSESAESFSLKQIHKNIDLKIGNFQVVKDQDDQSNVSIPNQDQPLTPNTPCTPIHDTSPNFDINRAAIGIKISNKNQYVTKYKNFHLKATNNFNKNLKLVIDTQKQVIMIFGPCCKRRMTMTKHLSNPSSNTNLTVNTKDDMTPKVRRSSYRIGYNDNISDGHLTEVDHLMPLTEQEIMNIKEICIFTPVGSKILQESQFVPTAPSFARSNTHVCHSDKDSQFGDMKSSFESSSSSSMTSQDSKSEDQANLYGDQNTISERQDSDSFGSQSQSEQSSPFKLSGTICQKELQSNLGALKTIQEDPRQASAQKGDSGDNFSKAISKARVSNMERRKSFMRK